jgi:hypothetical protein
MRQGALASDSTTTIASVNEAHFAEVEKALLYVSEARERAERAAKTIARDGGDQHLVNALEEADHDLLSVHRRLMQATYFAVPRQPEEQLAI